MFCLPVAEYPTTIATWALFVYSVMRLPSTWRSLIPTYRSTPFRLLLAWTLWSLLSIAWSSNPEAGLDHAGALRMGLLPLALWPVMRHWKCFLGAFLAGVLFQNLVQLSEVLTWFLIGKDWKTDAVLGSISGIENHTGKAALFMGFASLAWLGFYISGKRHRTLVIICAVLTTVGMFATVSMAVTVGFVVAAVVFCVFVIMSKKISLLHLFYIALTVLLIVASLMWFSVGERSQSKYQSAIQGVQEFYDGKVDAGNSTQLRLHWWAETLKRTFDEHEIIYGIVGHGFGSVASIDFSKEGSSIASRSEHIHNSYIQILYEQGVVGLIFFLSIFWAMVRTAKKLVVGFNWSVYPICVSATLLWAVSTFFENSQSSGRPLAMLFLLATLIMYNSLFVTGVKQT